MKTLLLSLVTLSAIAGSSQVFANTEAYRVCVETCHAWEGKADPKDIRRCVELYCKRHLMEEILKKAELPELEQNYGQATFIE